MPIGILVPTAFLPILSALLLMITFRWPARKAMPCAWLVAVICAAAVWKTGFTLQAASRLQGFGNAFTVLLIVVGAILILSTLTENGALGTINQGFRRISRDRRIQTMVIASARRQWFIPRRTWDFRTAKDLGLQLDR